MYEYYLIVAGVFTIGIGGYRYYRRKRAQWLEEKQLQMFIDQLIWDDDDKRWMVEESCLITPLKAMNKQS